MCYLCCFQAIHFLQFQPFGAVNLTQHQVICLKNYFTGCARLKLKHIHLSALQRARNTTNQWYLPFLIRGEKAIFLSIHAVHCFNCQYFFRSLDDIFFKTYHCAVSCSQLHTRTLLHVVYSTSNFLFRTLCCLFLVNVYMTQLLSSL